MPTISVALSDHLFQALDELSDGDKSIGDALIIFAMRDQLLRDTYMQKRHDASSEAVANKKRRERLAAPIASFDLNTLSVRSRNVLFRGINDGDLEMLSDVTYNAITEIRNCGETAAREILEWKERILTQ